MHANNTISDGLIDNIADGLQQHGFVQLPSFLPATLAQQLQQEAISLSKGDFTPAGIGRNNDQHVNKKIRSDSTLWFDGHSHSQQHYLAWMESLRIGLNRRLFMGLSEFECHFSHYAPGDFYQRHLDAFKGGAITPKSNRQLSTVLYLNSDWAKKDGGELLLYADEQTSPLLIVEPTFNSCMLFLSDTFPHEVLASKADRFSVAGWYRV